MTVESTEDGGRGVRSARRQRTGRAWLGLLLTLLPLTGCNPLYVARAGWAQMGILRSRVPFSEVLADSTTEAETRRKVALIVEARAYAEGELGFLDAGDSYTSLAPLESDTLALVLSAAYRDRLAFRTWWFPIVGSVPYRGYFSVESAEKARDELESEGFDTYLRPTAAFSTLGWFADPLYSTLLRQDDVSLVESVLHELAHNHLYVPGQGVFNESFANFVGYAAAIEFFCTSAPPVGPDEANPTVRRGSDSDACSRAHDLWNDAMTVSRYLDGLEAEVRELYGRNPPPADLMDRRARLFGEARTRFVNEVQPSLRASTYSYLGSEPLNNATLLSRSLYYRRLPDFHAFLSDFSGSFAELMAWFRGGADRAADPFDLLAERPDSAEIGALAEGRPSRPLTRRPALCTFPACRNWR